MIEQEATGSAPGPHQVVVVLDVAQVNDAEVVSCLADRRRERTILRLSTESQRKPDPPGAMKGPYPWDLLCRTVEALARKAQAACATAEGDAVLYVAGRAPLPLFVQLGHALPKFGIDMRVLNPYRGGPWIEYRVAASPNGGISPFFDKQTGLPADGVKASGVVSVYVSTIGAPAPEQAFREALQQIDHESAGVVEIRTAAAGDVTPEVMGQLAGELYKELPRVKDTYPNAMGMALFVAGPVPLAVAAGRALNFHAQRDIWVMNYDRERAGEGNPGYEVAVVLPFRSQVRILTNEPAAQLARREALDAMIQGIEELRSTLKRDDFPSRGAATARRYLGFLSDLRFRRDPEGDAFALHIAQREMSVGRGLLEALSGQEPAALGRFAQLLLLHELHHDGQDLRTANYAEIGRAGFVLEEVDFWADAFALETLIAWELRQGGPRALRRASEIAAGWITTALTGIEAFDRFEHGPRIEPLAERRLRRYLIWHLQRQRAETVRGRDDVRQLFEERLFVELAPLRGTLDARGDKLIKEAQKDRTEIFAVLRGRLIRRGPGPSFDPAGLVQAVREYEQDSIRQIMRRLVDDHRSVLAPWTDV